MPQRTVSSRTIRLQVPIAQCQRIFTPAGEELWVDGWSPTYLYPPDGRTEPGMVFTTGSGADFTVWTLLDFDTDSHYARYSRVTPATRTAVIEVRCTESSEGVTDTEVSYTVTALNESGVSAVESYCGEAFVEMIDGWKRRIEARLPTLLTASIR